MKITVESNYSIADLLKTDMGKLMLSDITGLPTKHFRDMAIKIDNQALIIQTRKPPRTREIDDPLYAKRVQLDAIRSRRV